MFLGKSYLGNFGLIFVRRDDMISLSLMSITKEKFTMMGFYLIDHLSNDFNSDDSDDTKYQVYFKLSYENVEGEWPTYSTDLQYLINDPLITLIGIKKLKDNINQKTGIGEIEDLIRSQFIDEIIPPTISVNEYVDQLFSLSIMSKPTTIADNVNVILYKCNLYDQMNDKYEPKPFIENEVVNFFINHKIRSPTWNFPFLFLYLNSSNSSPLNLDMILNDEVFFLPFEIIHQRDEVDTRQENSFFNKYQPIFRKLINAIFEKCGNSYDVIDGIEFGRSLIHQHDNNLKDTCQHIFQYLNQCLIERKIDRKLFNEKIQKLKPFFSNIDDIKQKINEDDHIIIISENNQHNIEKCFKRFYKTIQNIINNINNNQNVVVNINQLIHVFNKLISFLGDNITNKNNLIPFDIFDTDFSHPAIVVSKSIHNDINIKLMNDKIIVLTTQNKNDLSDLNQEELTEILEFLDIFVSTEKLDIDQLKAQIIEKISELNDGDNN